MKMKIRRVDFSPDEWIAGTIMLSPEERGVYITICAMIYSEGGPIVMSQEWPRLFACHGNKLKAIIERLTKLRKISRNGSEISQKRCGNELEKAQKRHENALENGWKGGRPRKEPKDIEKPAGSRGGKLTRVPSTINHQPSDGTERDKESLSPAIDRKAAKRELESEFEQFWEIFPRKRDKGHALKQFVVSRKATPFAVIHDGLLRLCREAETRDPQFVPYPATWLKGQQWLDEEEVPHNGGGQSQPAADLVRGFAAAARGNGSAGGEALDPLLDGSGADRGEAGTGRGLDRRPLRIPPGSGQ